MEGEQHDLSALDGLLGDIDIEDVPDEDPRTAKLQALYEQAKATYVAKVDTPRWFVQDVAVPIPSELLRARREEKNASTHQEWTVNYLYSEAKYEACLAYCASFALSMQIAFPFESDDDQKPMVGGSKTYQRRTKEERDLSKNWGIVKDIVDAGMRCVSTLLRSQPVSSSLRATAKETKIKTWVPSGTSYVWTDASLLVLAQGFMHFAARETCLGTGDPRYGYSGMVVRDRAAGRFSLDLAKVRLQNWTVSFGIALTLGNLALELGYHRAAIEAHSLFLANRGLMWRVLLSLARALGLYSDEANSADKQAKKAMRYIAKAAAVSAIQSSPKQYRTQVAEIVLSGAVLPIDFIQEAINPTPHSTPFTEEDQLLSEGLLQCDTDAAQPLADEIAICLVKVIFAKKGGVITVHDKFDTYVKEYHSRQAEGAFEFGEDDDTNDASEGGPRSVRTL